MAAVLLSRRNDIHKYPLERLGERSVRTRGVIRGHFDGFSGCVAHIYVTRPHGATSFVKYQIYSLVALRIFFMKISPGRLHTRGGIVRIVRRYPYHSYILNTVYANTAC